MIYWWCFLLFILDGIALWAYAHQHQERNDRASWKGNGGEGLAALLILTVLSGIIPCRLMWANSASRVGDDEGSALGVLTAQKTVVLLLMFVFVIFVLLTIAIIVPSTRNHASSDASGEGNPLEKMDKNDAAVFWLQAALYGVQIVVALFLFGAYSKQAKAHAVAVAGDSGGLTAGDMSELAEGLPSTAREGAAYDRASARTRRLVNALSLGNAASLVLVWASYFVTSDASLLAVGILFTFMFSANTFLLHSKQNDLDAGEGDPELLCLALQRDVVVTCTGLTIADWFMWLVLLERAEGVNVWKYLFRDAESQILAQFLSCLAVLVGFVVLTALMICQYQGMLSKAENRADLVERAMRRIH
jgi:hypothetical protein